MKTHKKREDKNLDLNIEERTATDKKGEEFVYKVAISPRNILMKCRHCGSKKMEHFILKNGGIYPEIIHHPNCPLFKTHKKREDKKNGI